MGQNYSDDGALSRLRQLAFTASLVAAALLTGCGFPSNPSGTGACSAGTLVSTEHGSPNFSITPVNTDFTIYPGQTEQLTVQVNAGNSATGTVAISGISLPQGITVSSATAAMGSTATLTISASNNVVAQCFTGIQYVFSAGRALTLTATQGTASFTTQIPITVVLENPAFVPTTTNLPILSINTTDQAPIVSEDDYVDATLTIADPTNASNNYTGTLEIKGHGNSTWAEPKKPYRLNLDSKAALLGMTSDTNWILLANYDYKAMLRTDVSFYMSQLFGMAWTPNTAFVEVFLNNVYEGTYQLSEKVEVSKARLDIGSIDTGDDSGTDLTGGYLGEIDHYDGETLMITAPNTGLPIGLADPDPPDAIQGAYFTAAFNAAENSMYSANFTDPTTGWPAYWDQDSLVDWFLIEELAGNQDADDWSSDYFYKPRGDNLFYRGPVWDMDVTFGNDNYGAIGSPNVPWVPTQARWYEQLFKDPTFVAAVKARWTAVRPLAATLPAYMDTRAAALTLTAQNNYSRWTTLDEVIWPNQVAEGTYLGEVDYMKNWFNQRLAYMDANYLQN